MYFYCGLIYVCGVLADRSNSCFARLKSAWEFSFSHVIHSPDSEWNEWDHKFWNCAVFRCKKGKLFRFIMFLLLNILADGRNLWSDIVFRIFGAVKSYQKAAAFLTNAPHYYSVTIKLRRDTFPLRNFSLGNCLETEKKEWRSKTWDAFFDRALSWRITMWRTTEEAQSVFNSPFSVEIYHPS